MFKVLLSIGGLQPATMVVLLVRTKFLAVFPGPDGVGLMAVIDKQLAVLVQTVSLSFRTPPCAPARAVGVRSARVLPELSRYIGHARWPGASRRTGQRAADVDRAGSGTSKKAP